ncbi:MAG: stage V sporulation T C-terminal domain-containing protein [Oscillospiraceae bacterium]
MKATGIVRRIDDLGRVVIPKEIRRTMRIRCGDPLEIFTEAGGDVIFKKYSPIGELTPFAAQYAEVLYKTIGTPVLITDREHIIAVGGSAKKECLDNRISEALENIIEKRRVCVGEDAKIKPCENAVKNAAVVVPIVAAGDAAGSVVLMDDTSALGECEVKLATVAAAFFAKQLE